MPRIAGANQWPELPYLGPAISEEVTRGREDGEKYKHGQNSTPSLRCIPFPDPRLSATNDDILNRTKQSTGGVFITVAEEIVDQCSTQIGVTAVFEESIHELARRRFHGMFQQLLLTFNTKNYYRVGQTIDQPESAKKRVLINEAGTKRAQIPLDASHNTAIPCLEVCKGTEWEAYKQRHLLGIAAPKPTFHRFMEQSDAYRLWNAGLEMPKKFNTSVDNTIDLQEDGLRNRGIRLINMASEGLITPEKGLLEFGRKFMQILNREHLRALQQYNSIRVQKKKEDLAAKALGIQIYIQETGRILQMLENDPKGFNEFLYMRFDENEAEATTTKLLQMRYKAIQQNMAMQSKIMQKIAAVQKRVFLEFKKTPPYADDAFNYLLAESMPNPADRNRINSLLALAYELRPNATRQADLTKATTALKTVTVEIPGPRPHPNLRVVELGETVIKRLANEISGIMTEMREWEKDVRVEVLKELREMRGLSLRGLSAVMQRLTGNIPVSHTTIWRIEHKERPFTALEADWYAKAFKVDNVLFMPQNFNS